MSLFLHIERDNGRTSCAVKGELLQQIAPRTSGADSERCGKALITCAIRRISTNSGGVDVADNEPLPNGRPAARQGALYVPNSNSRPRRPRRSDCGGVAFGG